MRIISGKYSGRFFQPPKKMPARPTTDIAKQGLFNILQNQFDFDEIHFLDLFGGTGSISYEAASRGCEYSHTIEIDTKLVQFIKSNFELLQLPKTCQVFKMDIFKYLQTATEQFDLIFAGPPYPLPNLNTIPDKVFDAKVLKENGWFVLEHNPNHNFDNHPNFFKKRNYGSTIFSIFTNEAKNVVNKTDTV
jgi:16S rRNA (guanine(966)-N(2))-methyltransferase RsmD